MQNLKKIHALAQLKVPLQKQFYYVDLSVERPLLEREVVGSSPGGTIPKL